MRIHSLNNITPNNVVTAPQAVCNTNTRQTARVHSPVIEEDWNKLKTDIYWTFDATRAEKQNDQDANKLLAELEQRIIDSNDAAEIVLCVAGICLIGRKKDDLKIGVLNFSPKFSYWADALNENKKNDESAALFALRLITRGTRVEKIKQVFLACFDSIHDALPQETSVERLQQIRANIPALGMTLDTALLKEKLQDNLPPLQKVTGEGWEREDKQEEQIEAFNTGVDRQFTWGKEVHKAAVDFSLKTNTDLNEAIELAKQVISSPLMRPNTDAPIYKEVLERLLLVHSIYTMKKEGVEVEFTANTMEGIVAEMQQKAFSAYLEHHKTLQTGKKSKAQDSTRAIRKVNGGKSPKGMTSVQGSQYSPLLSSDLVIEATNICIRRDWSDTLKARFSATNSNTPLKPLTTNNGSKLFISDDSSFEIKRCAIEADSITVDGVTLALPERQAIIEKTDNSYSSRHSVITVKYRANGREQSCTIRNTLTCDSGKLTFLPNAVQGVDYNNSIKGHFQKALKEIAQCQLQLSTGEVRPNLNRLMIDPYSCYIKPSTPIPSSVSNQEWDALTDELMVNFMLCRLKDETAEGIYSQIDTLQDLYIGLSQMDQSEEVEVALPEHAQAFKGTAGDALRKVQKLIPLLQADQWAFNRIQLCESNNNDWSRLAQILRDKYITQSQCHRGLEDLRDVLNNIDRDGERGGLVKCRVLAMIKHVLEGNQVLSKECPQEIRVKLAELTGQLASNNGRCPDGIADGITSAAMSMLFPTPEDAGLGEHISKLFRNSLHEAMEAHATEKWGFEARTANMLALRQYLYLPLGFGAIAQYTRAEYPDFIKISSLSTDLNGLTDTAKHFDPRNVLQNILQGATIQRATQQEQTRHATDARGAWLRDSTGQYIMEVVQPEISVEETIPGFAKKETWIALLRENYHHEVSQGNVSIEQLYMTEACKDPEIMKDRALFSSEENEDDITCMPKPTKYFAFERGIIMPKDAFFEELLIRFGYLLPAEPQN